jgi:hypothetical protein
MCECEWNGLRILRGSIKASVFDRAGEVREKTLKNSAEELALNERGIVGWAFSFPTSLTRSQYAMTPKPWRALLFRSTDTFFTRALRLFDLIAVIRNRSTPRPVMPGTTP